ncbi:hypothetical protein [Flavobacterium aestuarii]|uniref:hypothetical protein n=1 Tax=Flavobacterium aestuarii TaxID=3149227 RepID=UPI0032B6012C
MKTIIKNEVNGKMPGIESHRIITTTTNHLNKRTIQAAFHTPIIESIIETIVEPIIYKC